MAAAAAPQDPGRLAAAVLSVGMHPLLLLVLIVGVSWQSRTPDVVEVELWQPAPEPVIEPPPPPKPVVQPEPKPEPPPVVKKPDIVIEKEKKPPPKKEPPKKEEPKKEQKLNLDLSQQIKEQLQRELESAQKERERQKALEAFKGAPVPAPAVRGPIDPGYANRISARIKALIVLPPDIVGNPEAVFDVEQVRTALGGEVMSVKLRRSSGNRAYDDAVERAIRKASPLPLPERAEQFQRRLELHFRPRE